LLWPLTADALAALCWALWAMPMARNALQPLTQR
jgi:hypothetical protein